eukprot:906910-Pyramimonas_sp.AAC.1
MAQLGQPAAPLLRELLNILLRQPPPGRRQHHGCCTPPPRIKDARGCRACADTCLQNGMSDRPGGTGISPWSCLSARSLGRPAISRRQARGRPTASKPSRSSQLRPSAPRSDCKDNPCQPSAGSAPRRPALASPAS